MKWVNYIIARFYQERAAKALKAYNTFRVKAEKYFSRAGL